MKYIQVPALELVNIINSGKRAHIWHDVFGYRQLEKYEIINDANGAPYAVSFDDNGPMFQLMQPALLYVDE